MLVVVCDEETTVLAVAAWVGLFDWRVQSQSKSLFHSRVAEDRFSSRNGFNIT
jgi:hypothetical protein